MLIAFQSIYGATLTSTNGNVGTVADLFFDTEDWIVRHIVADTGKWLPGRRVLLPPAVIGECDWQRQMIAVGLTQQQVKDSPHVDNDKPISRQMETEIFNHYDVPVYWGPAGSSLAGGGPVAVPLSSQVPVEEQKQIEQTLPRLRSASEVKTYYIKATDGDLGHVEEFLVDDGAWAIRYLVVDTKNWLPARKVLVSPQWIDSISWSDATVTVNMTQEQIKGSPEYDPLTPVNRGYEEHLYDYYGHKRYWVP